MSVSFDVSRSDQETIRKIAARVRPLLREESITLTKLQICMDLTATHANGCRLRLLELLEADKFNLLHDVLGIAMHLNRDTGKLGGCFVPRYAAP